MTLSNWHAGSPPASLLGQLVIETLFGMGASTTRYCWHRYAHEAHLLGLIENPQRIIVIPTRAAEPKRPKEGA